MTESRVGSGAEGAFLRSLASGELRLAELTEADLMRMAELVEQYSNLPLGAADASVVAVAERFKRAGHSVEVLLRVYAKCLDEGTAAANRRIEAALLEAS